MRYASGTILRTWNERHGVGVTLSELAAVPGLKSVVASTHSYSRSFLLESIPSGVPITIAVGRPSGKTGKSSPSNLKELSHDPYPYNAVVQHIKLFLLFGEYTRVVISTANTVRFDWTVAENHLFVIDLPLRTADDAPGSLSLFEMTLADALTGLEISRSRWFEPLEATDLRLVDMQGFRLVNSRPQLRDKTPAKPGLLGLGAALGSLQIRSSPGEVVRIEYAASSFTSERPVFLAALYNQAVGAEVGDRARVRKGRLVLPDGGGLATLWPDDAEVAKSTLGASGFSRVYKGHPQWEDKAFPHGIFHRNRSKLARSLMHTKFCLGVLVDAKLQTQRSAWIYIGSANMTSAAWGKPGEEGGYSVNNHELGVVLFDDAHTLDALVPWQRPIVPFTGTDRPHGAAGSSSVAAAAHTPTPHSASASSQGPRTLESATQSLAGPSRHRLPPTPAPQPYHPRTVPRAPVPVSTPAGEPVRSANGPYPPALAVTGPRPCASTSPRPLPRADGPSPEQGSSDACQRPRSPGVGDSHEEPIEID